MIDCCLLFQVWWWILDVTVVGLLEDIGCRQNNIKQRNNQATNQPADQPTNQPPSNQCQGSPNPRAKTPLVGWWILDVIVASVSVVCRGWSPPPNSGHMSDTSNISNIVHCCLLFQVCWWILDVTVVGRHIQYPPPPNSGHMSDT